MKIAVSVVIVAAAVAAIVFSAFGSSTPYKHVSELLTAADSWTGKTVRLQGKVEPLSIKTVTENQRTVLKFNVYEDCKDNQNCRGKTIPVVYTGSRPDSFDDDAAVVATGTLRKAANGAYVFHSGELLAKCPSKYEAAGGTLGKNAANPTI